MTKNAPIATKHLMKKYHIHLFMLSIFRLTDLELHLSEKGTKKVEEDMGYIKLQVKLVPKTQEEKEQVGIEAGDQQDIQDDVCQAKTEIRPRIRAV